jgi:hypothetical protein
MEWNRMEWNRIEWNGLDWTGRAGHGNGKRSNLRPIKAKWSQPKASESKAQRDEAKRSYPKHSSAKHGHGFRHWQLRCPIISRPAFREQGRWRTPSRSLFARPRLPFASSDSIFSCIAHSTRTATVASAPSLGASDARTFNCRGVVCNSQTSGRGCLAQ